MDGEDGERESHRSEEIRRRFVGEEAEERLGEFQLELLRFVLRRHRQLLLLVGGGIVPGAAAEKKLKLKVFAYKSNNYTTVYSSPAGRISPLLHSPKALCGYAAADVVFRQKKTTLHLISGAASDHLAYAYLDFRPHHSGGGGGGDQGIPTTRGGGAGQEPNGDIQRVFQEQTF